MQQAFENAKRQRSGQRNERIPPNAGGHALPEQQPQILEVISDKEHMTGEGYLPATPCEGEQPINMKEDEKAMLQ